MERRYCQGSEGIAARRVCATLCVFALAISPVRADAGLGKNTQRELQSILTSLPHARTVAGACVIDIPTGQTVFTLNADKPLIPASTMKVFALATALDVLGPDFTFETTLATDGRNLIVIGDGDPSIGDQKLATARKQPRFAFLDQWVEALSTHGITSVEGDLIIDASVFDDQTVHPSWEQADLGKWYAAPVSGLNINGNCLDVTLHPGKSAGSAVSVTVKPQTRLAKIINKCTTGSGRNPILHHRPGTFDYVVSGKCKKRWPFVAAPFPDPPLLFADALRVALANNGITLHGEIRRAPVRQQDETLPAGVTVLATYRTPLRDVLARAGKDSQNLFAECLLKRVGYARSREGASQAIQGSSAIQGSLAIQGHSAIQGSWASGSSVAMRLARRTGIDATGLVIDDGSGLSRTNRCSAAQLAGVMSWSAGQPTAGLFADSLSLAGIDGSLRKRLKNSNGRVRGKTGTMRGVRTLAGFVYASAKPRFAFAVMFNGYKGPSTPYRRIQDRVCSVLLRRADVDDSR